MHKEPTELEYALRWAEKREVQAVRAAVVSGILAQLKVDETRAQALSVLLECSNPRARRAGQLLKDGVPGALAGWLVMQEIQPAAPVGNQPLTAIAYPLSTLIPDWKPPSRAPAGATSPEKVPALRGRRASGNGPRKLGVETGVSHMSVRSATRAD